MKTPRVPLLLPVLLASVGAAVLAGCIPVPVYKTVNGGPRPETRIGKPGSKKPLLLGRATRGDVRALLGRPTESPGGRTDLYTYPITTFAVIAACGQGFDDVQERYLRLEYDDAGILRRFKVYKDYTQASATTDRGA